MINYVSKSEWLSLSGDVRKVLKEAFKMKEDEAIQVRDDSVISDGMSADALIAGFTIESMQKYTGKSAEDFHYLWMQTVEKASNLQAVAAVEEAPAAPTPEKAPKSPKAPKAQAKKKPTK